MIDTLFPYIMHKYLVTDEVSRLKHSVSKGDKKKKKEITAQIAQLEKELAERHKKEVQEFKESNSKVMCLYSSNTKVTKELLSRHVFRMASDPNHHVTYNVAILHRAARHPVLTLQAVRYGETNHIRYRGNKQALTGMCYLLGTKGLTALYSMVLHLCVNFSLLLAFQYALCHNVIMFSWC